MAAPRLGRMAGRIRDSDIAEVRDRTRIDEVVGEYVALRRAGAGSLKGLCPFHDEKTPSFTVRPSHNSFHCFGCAEGGGVIDVRDADRAHRVRRGRRAAGRPDRLPAHLHGGGSSVQRDRGTRSRLLEANKKAAEFYAAALRTPEAAPGRRSSSPPAGSTAAAAQTFGCGYAPAGLGRAHQAPARRRVQPGRADEGRALQGGPPRPDRPVPPPAALADPRPRRRRRRLRRPPDLRRRPASRPSTSTPPRRPSTARRTCCSGSTWPSARSPRAARSSSSRATRTSWPCTSPACRTAVASCGTAFGAEHVSVIRRLIGDDSFDLGEVIYTFDGDAAGQAAALKAFDGDQSVRRPDLRARSRRTGRTPASCG